MRAHTRFIPFFEKMQLKTRSDLHRAAARHLLHAQGHPSIMIPLLATKEVLAIVCVLCSPSPLEIRMANMPPHLRWFAALGHQRALRLVGCILVGGPQGNLCVVRQFRS